MKRENQRLSACHCAKPITSSRSTCTTNAKKTNGVFGELCPAAHNCIRCVARSPIVCDCECHMTQFLAKLVLQENTTAGINISLAGWLAGCLSVHRHAKVTPKLSNFSTSWQYPSLRYPPVLAGYPLFRPAFYLNMLVFVICAWVVWFLPVKLTMVMVLWPWSL